MGVLGIRKLLAFGLFAQAVVIIVLYAPAEARSDALEALLLGLAGFYGVNGWVHKKQGGTNGNAAEVR